MASASTLPPPFLSGLRRHSIKSDFLPLVDVRKKPNRNPNFSPKRLPIRASSSDISPSSSWEREETRWLREEQRWLREEQRWMREESRWRSERESLLREIAALRLRVEALELKKSPAAAVDTSIGRISEVGLRPVLVEEVEVEKMILEEVGVSDRRAEKIFEGDNEKKKAKKKEKKTLRKGSEGEDVRVMQDALFKLGFYCGEEDMEYSSFSSGTERAVKTWQASLGTLEDGIMTWELLERLFEERSLKDIVQGGGSVSALGVNKDGTNGAPSASVSEITEIKQSFIKESGVAEVEVSEHRVFLLGENRWEEPSRLRGRDKPISGIKNVSPIKCLTCRGEGRLLCTECDGTGEPNIEPQFMEWIDEGAKCPYCEGLGYTVCDVCEGTTTRTQNS